MPINIRTYIHIHNEKYRYIIMKRLKIKKIII